MIYSISKLHSLSEELTSLSSLSSSLVTSTFSSPSSSLLIYKKSSVNNVTHMYKWNKHVTKLFVARCIKPENTVEPRFNEPLFNEVLDITNDTLRPGQSYSKMYGIKPRYNEPRYNEFFDITNIIRKPKRKIYLDITNYSVNTRQKINAEQIQQSTNPLIFILLYIIDISTEVIWLCYKSVINYDLDVTNFFGCFPLNSLYRGFRFKVHLFHSIFIKLQ